MNEYEDLIREMYRLENDPMVAKRELRLFMQHPMSCGHAIAELFTCDTPDSPSGCACCESGKKSYRAGVDEFRKWSDVAFYPGPNESPEFQAGFMTAVHEVARIAARLLEEKS